MEFRISRFYGAIKNRKIGTLVIAIRKQATNLSLCVDKWLCNGRMCDPNLTDLLNDNKEGGEA